MSYVDLSPNGKVWVLSITYYKPLGDASDTRSLAIPVYPYSDPTLFPSADFKTAVLGALNTYAPAVDEELGGVTLSVQESFSPVTD